VRMKLTTAKKFGEQLQRMEDVLCVDSCLEDQGEVRMKLTTAKKFGELLQRMEDVLCVDSCLEDQGEVRMKLTTAKKFGERLQRMEDVLNSLQVNIYRHHYYHKHVYVKISSSLSS